MFAFRQLLSSSGTEANIADEVTDMAERGERRLQEHGQHAGRPPVQGGRSAGTHVELGGVGSAQERAVMLADTCAEGTLTAACLSGDIILDRF